MLAHRYSERLAALAAHVTVPLITERTAATSPAWYVYVIEADRRDGLAEHLARRGITTEVYYQRPLHLQPCFEPFGFRRGQFPNAERACERTLALPLYPDLSCEAVELVVDSIEEFYRR